MLTDQNRCTQSPASRYYNRQTATRRGGRRHRSHAAAVPRPDRPRPEPESSAKIGRARTRSDGMETALAHRPRRRSASAENREGRCDTATGLAGHDGHRRTAGVRPDRMDEDLRGLRGTTGPTRPVCRESSVRLALGGRARSRHADRGLPSRASCAWRSSAPTSPRSLPYRRRSPRSSSQGRGSATRPRRRCCPARSTRRSSPPSCRRKR